MKIFFREKTNDIPRMLEYLLLFLAVTTLYLSMNFLNTKTVQNTNFSLKDIIDARVENKNINKLSFLQIHKHKNSDKTKISHDRMTFVSRGSDVRSYREDEYELQENQMHKPSTSFGPTKPPEDSKVKGAVYLKNSDVEKLNNPNFTQEDVYWLSRIIQAETPGDISEGQIAVANVVLNRLNSGWERTIKRVIFQRINGTYQFTPVEDGAINNTPSRRAINNAIRALNGKRVVPENVYYFYMPASYNENDWIRTRTIYRTIGVHRFCF